MIALISCTVNYNEFVFEQDSTVPATKEQVNAQPGTETKATNVMVFYTPGASITTDKNQRADAKGAFSMPGSNTAVGNQDNPSATNYTPVTMAQEAKEIVDAVDSPATVKPEEVKPEIPIIDFKY